MKWPEEKNNLARRFRISFQTRPRWILLTDIEKFVNGFAGRPMLECGREVQRRGHRTSNRIDLSSRMNRNGFETHLQRTMSRLSCYPCLETIRLVMVTLRLLLIPALLPLLDSQTPLCKLFHGSSRPRTE